jgi:hypothetical protein
MSNDNHYIKLFSCCYVFSAIDSITSLYMKKYNQMLNISIQEVVDCSSAWGNVGCFGGSMENVFRYAWNQNGFTTESMYPYTATINVLILNFELFSKINF